MESTCSISIRSQLAQDLLDTDFIIWYETLMCHRWCVEAVDRSLRDMTKRIIPFGENLQRIVWNSYYSLQSSDKFCQSFSEARDLRFFMLASSLPRYMQSFALYVSRRTRSFRLCETTRMRQRQHCSFQTIFFVSEKASGNSGTWHSGAWWVSSESVTHRYSLQDGN